MNVRESDNENDVIAIRKQRATFSREISVADVLTVAGVVFAAGVLYMQVQDLKSQVDGTRTWMSKHVEEEKANKDKTDEKLDKILEEVSEIRGKLAPR